MDYKLHHSKSRFFKKHIVDYLTKKQKLNRDKVPMYYVWDNFRDIITAEKIDIVKREIVNDTSELETECKRSILIK